MNAGRLLLLLLLIVVAVVVVLVVLRRGSAQRDAQRVEAAGLRTEADTLAATMAGQSAYAEQAAQRAELARVEAEDKAREAERLQAEAAQHRATVEAAQRDYDNTMRRADDMDPDVKESAFPPVSETARHDDDDDGVGEPATDGPGSSDAAPAAAAATAPAAAAALDGDDHDTPERERTEDDALMTRAERREAREAGGSHSGDGSDDPAAHDDDEAAVPTAAAGAAASGATAWATREEPDRSPESERIASATDFRDDVPAERADAREVYPEQRGGSDSGMSEETDTGTNEHSQRDDGLGAGEAAGLAATGAGGAYAATRALQSDRSDEMGEDRAEGGSDAAEGSGTDDLVTDSRTDENGTDAGTDVSHDVETPRGEWGGPHDDESAVEGSGSRTGETPDTGRREGSVGEPGEVTMIAEPEAYAATEPVMAQDQTSPVAPADADDDTRVGESNHATDREVGDSDETTRVGDSATSMGGSDHDGHDHEGHVHDGHDHGEADRRSGTELEDADHAPAEAGAAVTEVDETDRGGVHDSAEDRFDTTPTRDWAADEGELLQESSQRGDRLEEERAELAGQDEGSTGATASGQWGADDSRDASDDDASRRASVGRRVSGFDELRDGGFGVGSAAPLHDGAQPLDHPVQADRDSMTYRLPGDAGYDASEPHVWFYDEGAAQRSGFRRSDG